MIEQTQNNPLNGGEVIEAIVDKLREKLRRDCYLNPNSSYEWFTAKLTIELDLQDAGVHVPVKAAIEMEQGIAKDGEIGHVEAELEIEAEPPNKVRVDTGQPVPVLTKDPETGKLVEKGVRYSRKTKTGAAVALFLLMALPFGHAQATKPAAPTVPEMTTAEKVAISAIAERYTGLQQQQREQLNQLRIIEAEIEKEHPGYHYDERTNQIVKTEEKKK